MEPPWDWWCFGAITPFFPTRDNRRKTGNRGSAEASFRAPEAVNNKLIKKSDYRSLFLINPFAGDLFCAIASGQRDSGASAAACAALHFSTNSGCVN
jgi:hypothetical protein